MHAQDPPCGSQAAEDYDAKAEEYDWRGPEVAFGLSYAFVSPGQSILDIGIGTGLSSVLFHKAGLHVYGMDISAKMLDACRRKGFATDLKQHDLTVIPYPYGTASLDHAVCLGVLNQFEDLQPVFGEVGRILRDGIFVFVVADRAPGEKATFRAGPEHTESDLTVTLYRHGTEDVNHLIKANGFVSVRSLEFPVPMDRQRKSILPAKAYVVRRKT